MSQSPSPQDDPTEGFGPNEWLVAEMYEKYLQDPASLDKAWIGFFEDFKHTHGDTGPNGASRPAAPAPSSSSSSSSASSSAPAQRTAPSQRPAPQGTTAPPPSAPAPTPTAAHPVAPGARADAPTTTTPAAAPVPSATPSAAREVSTTPNQPPRPAATQAKAGGSSVTPLRGPAARVVTNMEASLEVPTATSVRAVPAKLLIDNRIVINNHLARGRGGKISFTHLIGYAVVRAVQGMPDMNVSYGEADGKPAVIGPEHVGLGLAIDISKPDGTRQLLVPAIKAADTMDFAQFWAAYEDIVRRARGGKLTADDFAGTTISLTNPGTIGTVHSVPRLMKGQGTIVGVGAMDYPAEYQGASPETLARLAVSKVLTLTSTYDHRVIQGAQSGEFLRRVHLLLLGEDGFYDDIFRALRIPYEPIRWAADVAWSHENDVTKQARVQELIHAYRVRGHLMADTDPLEFRQRSHPDLDITNHGLTLWDLDREFATGGFGKKPMATLRDILGVLRDSYCRRVGIEYMHIQDPEERRWIQSKVESPHTKTDTQEQLRILRRLNSAEAFETFLQTKFVGQKRFSLEGGESLIPLVDALLSEAADAGLDEAAIGMAHRGRLNVLANLAGKSYAQIFREFEGNQDPKSVQGSGDVKYHLGTQGTFTANSGAKCKVYLAANPSHLEAVDPVLEGIVRAKQDRLNKGGGESGYTVLPVLIHGDAAFAGQGVVAETLNLSQLRGYRTGGTVHVVVNNQVGFTTSPASSRSSFYSTDVARMIQAPIFHVNGDDPEACVRVARLAFEFRQKFRKDVVIDMVCYRRRGHNEGDDPSMTQPLMYSLIEQKRSVRKLYTEALIGRGDITVEEAEQALRDFQEQLERVFNETRETGAAGSGALEAPDEQRQTGHAHALPTAVSPEVIKRISDAHVAMPEGFTVHPKLRSLLERRAAMSTEGGIDWAMGELYAFGSLLLERVPVRLAGQDSRRGTFVQRHAVLTDRHTGDEWTPLANLSTNQGRFYVYDSLLSEFAAMGFEYGYSVVRPEVLVLWEAQFGDFVNGAQTIVDEFISSSEQKWGQRSSVVLLLPHGYEGQGPDHSSARIERFLQLCAEDNMTVAAPTTPASYFHLLRWQAYHEPRRPLIVATPKSMLRRKEAVSGPEEFTSGTFRPVIGEEGPVDPERVDRVLLCAGKVYWDLAAERTRRSDDRTAIVRVEQIAPLPAREILEAVSRFPNAELVWVQEEPGNQGAWPFVLLNLPDQLQGRQIRRVSRPASASPAVGSHKAHEAEQRELVAAAFDR
ncbi:multifunctional oxoglutarate decarboxylase/oxoglutarate dehydrogenase thiamine pyrophosphate-binding subunit/dihydrolipoyllysine-residue succinyltransferase subunit [Motilibacter aurantiacus]|uniref:multifunctional oxoglutarate decarboxylase/oxoglutarate dehydrogenase thiamine pyrophosphate-binding subunit/dihydrolipoyllysine-residue succinyltransferase subunit n=1 Tax=Motilibacter aurantiacus TaxID=2714955 RepID=UPI00140B6455|nr:multifunctional oxoglutarate decarboxylase/oxoglutarate dehydrogenase thiamine pyrophosphate-binding subunit/dihydrolipoyllysine-residue succinyltransferase subunit [Motilibacter aurantiacus]